MIIWCESVTTIFLQRLSRQTLFIAAIILNFLITMLTRQDILKFLYDNKEYLLKHFYLTKLGLFGSFARNEQTPDSDIDLLIERAPDAKNIFDTDWELQEMLKKEFNRNVDICTEKYIKPYAKSYILRDAIYV